MVLEENPNVKICGLILEVTGKLILEEYGQRELREHNRPTLFTKASRQYSRRAFRMKHSVRTGYCEWFQSHSVCGYALSVRI